MVNQKIGLGSQDIGVEVMARFAALQEILDNGKGFVIVVALFPLGDLVHVGDVYVTHHLYSKGCVQLWM